MTRLANDPSSHISRRRVVLAAPVILLAPGVACATADNDMTAAIQRITGGAALREGRVHIDIPPLAENGNSVTLTVSVDSPMTEADHVRSIHIVSEKNPIADVAKMHVGPRAGRARVSTSIRLATTQVVTAIAVMSDGTFWSGAAEVIVALAACTESG